MTQFVDAQGRPKKCIHRYSRQLVGLSHSNKNGKDRVALASTLRVGTSLILVPEPNNAFDRNAVLIYRADDPTEDLGYLDATGAKQICRMMECGATFDADVYWIDKRKEIPHVYIWLYQLTPMMRKSRPVRHNAPTYKNYVSHREAPTPPLTPAAPSFGQVGDEEFASGPISSLLRLLKSLLP